MTARRTRRADLTGPGNQYSAGFSRPMIHGPNVNPNQKMSHNSSTPTHTLGVSCGFELPHGTLLLLPSFQFVERVCNQRTVSAAPSALVAPLSHPGNFSKMPKKLSQRQGFQLRLFFCPSLDLFSVQNPIGPQFQRILACWTEKLSLTCATWVVGASATRLSGTISNGSSLGSALSHCAPRDGLLLGVV